MYDNKYLLIRPRIDSFVGPNRKVYQVIYNDGNELEIAGKNCQNEEENFVKIKTKIYAEKSTEPVNQFQIKTLGPYKKWEHTYDFSENGELVMNHSK